MMWNFLLVVLAVVIYCYTSEFFKLVNPESYTVELPEKLDGTLKPNDKLEKTEKLFENDLRWPESFAVHGGNIYTGLGDGRIVKIIGDSKYATIARTGKECAGQHEEHICGRPLGMEFDKNGRLFVADAYHGLFVIDVKTGKIQNILPSSTVVEGQALSFLNSIAIDDQEGVIYITQSTTKWDIGMVMVSILEHESSGRLLKYNLKTKETSVLLTNMSFPNGIVLSHDGNSLVIVEGIKNKIFKYHLKNKKTDLYTPLLVLPGEPDNISKTKRGTYWVGLASGRSKETPALHDTFSEIPLARAALLHFNRVIMAPVSAIMKLIPNKYINELGFELKTMRILGDMPNQHGIILEFDDNGNIVQSLHSPSGNICRISEVLEHNGYLYLGSWRNRFIGRLKV